MRIIIVKHSKLKGGEVTGTFTVPSATIADRHALTEMEGQEVEITLAPNSQDTSRTEEEAGVYRQIKAMVEAFEGKAAPAVEEEQGALL